MTTDEHLCVPVQIHTMAVETGLLERLARDPLEPVRLLACRALQYAREAAQAKDAARRAPAHPTRPRDSAAAREAIAAHYTAVSRELLAVAQQLRRATRFDPRAAGEAAVPGAGEAVASQVCGVLADAVAALPVGSADGAADDALRFARAEIARQIRSGALLITR